VLSGVDAASGAGPGQQRLAFGSEDHGECNARGFDRFGRGELAAHDLGTRLASMVLPEPGGPEHQYVVANLNRSVRPLRCFVCGRAKFLPLDIG